MLEDLVEIFGIEEDEMEDLLDMYWYEPEDLLPISEVCDNHKPIVKEKVEQDLVFNS